MRFVYTALRRLAPTHDEESQYTIVIAPHTLDPQFDMVGSEHTSLDRSRVERDLWGIDESYNVVTDFVADGQPNLEMLEFLHSTAGGEEFQFDPFAETATPVAPFNATMETRSFRATRPSPLKWQYTFTVRRVP